MSIDAELVALLILAALTSVAVAVLVFVVWPILQDAALALGFLIAVFAGAS